MRYAIAALMTMLCVTACGPRLSSSAPSIELVLPEIVEYSPAQQNAMADELFPKTGETACPVTKEAMKDYKVMRDETRAAKNSLQKD